MHFAHRRLSPQKRLFAAAEYGCTHISLLMCMYVSGFHTSHPLSWTLDHSSAYNSFLLSKLSSWEQSEHPTEAYKCCRLQQCMDIVEYSTVYRYLSFWPVFSSNSDYVKLEPQLCMNQNDNPQRYFLPLFPETLWFILSGELHSRKSIEAHRLSRHAYGACWGVAAGCPNAARSSWLCVCVCVQCSAEVRWPGQTQRSWRIGVHLWTPRGMLPCG